CRLRPWRPAGPAGQCRRRAAEDGRHGLRHRGGRRPSDAIARPWAAGGQGAWRPGRDAVPPQPRPSLAAAVRADVLAALGGAASCRDPAAFAALAWCLFPVLTRMVADIYAPAGGCAVSSMRLRMEECH